MIQPVPTTPGPSTRHPIMILMLVLVCILGCKVDMTTPCSYSYRAVGRGCGCSARAWDFWLSGPQPDALGSAVHSWTRGLEAIRSMNLRTFPEPQAQTNLDCRPSFERKNTKRLSNKPAPRFKPIKVPASFCMYTSMYIYHMCILFCVSIYYIYVYTHIQTDECT